MHEAVDGVMFQLGRSNMDNRMTADAVTDPPAVARTARPHLDDAAPELRALGLPANAGWDQICEAHARLVADLTPGPDAAHGNVGLAKRLLDEVNGAFDTLRARSSVA